VVQETSARRQGAQTLAYAHGGVDVASGSPAEVISKTAMMGEFEAQVQRNNAFREAYGYRQQAAFFRWAASSVELTGAFDMFGAIFRGAGGVAGMSAASGGGGFWGGAGQPAGWGDYRGGERF
jgi:hypothetical protein